MILGIMNSSADQRDTTERREKLENLLQSWGLDYDLKVTIGASDAFDWAKKTVTNRVIACSGDETIKDVPREIRNRSGIACRPNTLIKHLSISMVNLHAVKF